MNARTYYVGLLDAIHTAPHVIASEIRFEDIDINECYVRGVLTLSDGHVYPSPTMSIPDVLDAALSFILPSP